MIERTISFQSSGNSYEVFLRSDSAEVEDSFKVNLNFDSEDDNSGFAVELEYHNSASTENSTLLSQNAFKFEVHHLIEFSESGDTDGFQPDEDSIITNSTICDWDAWSVVTDDSYILFAINTTDGGLGIEVYLTPTNYSLNDVSITPNMMKINMNVYDFPYTSSGSRLAIEGQISTSETDSTQTVSIDGSTVILESSSSAVLGSVDWIDQATTESGIVDVIVTVSDDLGFLITFDTSSQPMLIQWDPILGYTIVLEDGTGSGENSDQSSFVAPSAYWAILLASFVLLI